MTLDQIKSNLFSDKVRALLQSDFEYTYRHACEFILEQYKTLAKQLTDESLLSHILPLAALPEFAIKNISGNELLAGKVLDNTLNQADKVSGPRLLEYAAGEEDWLVSLIFFKHSKLDWRSIQDKVRLMTIEQREKFFEIFFKNTKMRQELNFLNYTFEVALDFVTLQKLFDSPHQALLLQDLSLINGYVTPPEIVNAGLQSEYILALKHAINAFEEIRPSYPQLAKYIIPLAFLQKVLFTININQLINLNLPLANDLWSLIKKVHPTIYLALRS